MHPVRPKPICPLDGEDFFGPDDEPPADDTSPADGVADPAQLADDKGWDEALAVADAQAHDASAPDNAGSAFGFDGPCKPCAVDVDEADLGGE